MLRELLWYPGPKVETGGFALLSSTHVTQGKSANPGRLHGFSGSIKGSTAQFGSRVTYRNPLQVRMQVVPVCRLFIGMSNAAQHPLT